MSLPKLTRTLFRRRAVEDKFEALGNYVLSVFDRDPTANGGLIASVAVREDARLYVVIACLLDGQWYAETLSWRVHVHPAPEPSEIAACVKEGKYEVRVRNVPADEA